ncbi:MAG: substrate-binding domain-containing protein, partial [Fimbriimonadaceae bacterium]|nr:substrate-binding domain-containing protein [Fimbriimonadaceae bacterium]
DRLVGEDGKPLANVPHLGISAYEIGKLVGTAIVEEIKNRNWDMKSTGACVLTIDALETARERIRGAEEVIVAAGFPKENIFKAAWSKHDAVGATDTAMPVLSQHQNIKNWIGFTSNDDGVMGIVRATESKNIPSANVIGVGINGNTVDTEFSKESGFHASVLLSAREHGFKTAEMMYQWIKEGTAPPMETYTTGTLITRENWKDAWTKEGLN